VTGERSYHVVLGIKKSMGERRIPLLNKRDICNQICLKAR
jgi:hypothetical protein